jgi:hypothetical protein
LLLASLKSALGGDGEAAGTEPSIWQWGKLHHNLNEHPFAPSVDDATRARINVGPIAKNGSEHTPSQSLTRVTDFRQMNGPSVRIVVDVGNWDNSRAVNHPGQSGDPASAHYRDLAPLWADGRYFPLLYSRKAVEAATERVIRLVPRKPCRGIPMTVRLFLFGSPRIEYHGDSVVLPCERRGQLVALLALRRAWVGRAEARRDVLARDDRATRVRQPSKGPLPPAGRAVGERRRAAGRRDPLRRRNRRVRVRARAARAFAWVTRCRCAAASCSRDSTTAANETWTSWLQFERERLRAAWKKRGARSVVGAHRSCRRHRAVRAAAGVRPAGRGPRYART